MRSKYPKEVEIEVTAAHIASSKCGNPTHCMIRHAVAEQLGLVHGYVRVDATGVSITRRPDFREKSPLPKGARDALVIFDECGRLGLNPLEHIEPFSLKLKFQKTTKVKKVSAERAEQIEKARKSRAAAGGKGKIYPTERFAGVAVSQRVARKLNRLRSA